MKDWNNKVTAFHLASQGLVSQLQSVSEQELKKYYRSLEQRNEASVPEDVKQVFQNHSIKTHHSRIKKLYL